MISTVALALVLGAPPPHTDVDPPALRPAKPASTPTPTTDADPRDPWLSEYLIAMRAAGMLDNREASLEEIEDALTRAQDRYVRGDILGSAVLLFDLTQNPRYENFANLPIMGTVNYHLGVALEAYGAHKTATAAYATVLARGTDDPYFTPALRRHVDVALVSKNYIRGLGELEANLAAAGGVEKLAEVDRDEHDYLAARAAQQRADLDGALAAYGRVSSKSRFYTAATYLSGVIHSARRDFRRAESAFCEVVGGPKQSTAVFYVDRRYFPVRDLAHLGLGRVAHEERRHGHAFYHYFQVPQDSDDLPQALFEASWAMAEEGEYAVARGLITDLQDRFPRAPQATEARLLAALLKLYDCDFRTAEDEFTRLIDDLAPVADHIDEIRTDRTQLRALHEELTHLRAGTSDMSGDLPAHRVLLALLDEDPAYARMAQEADVLRTEARFARAVEGELLRARDRLLKRDTATARSRERDALDAVTEAHELERAVAGLERQLREAEAAGADPQLLAAEKEEAARLRKRARTLKGGAHEVLLAAPPIGTAQTQDLATLLGRDVARVRTMRSQALDLAFQVDTSAADVASARLAMVKRRIEDLMGEARMGRIDAVLGAKKKLEIEVRDMAAGKFPAELFGTLQIEGMVGDDEEFWPYEGEYWADEYEGYR